MTPDILEEGQPLLPDSLGVLEPSLLACTAGEAGVCSFDMSPMEVRLLAKGGGRGSCGILLGYSLLGTVSPNSPDGEEGIQHLLDDVYFGSWSLIDTVCVDIHDSMVMEALIYYQEFRYIVIQF